MVKNFEAAGDGGVELSGVERKSAILYDAMYRGQPQIEEFRGVRGFSERMLEADAEKLAARQRENVAADRAKMGRAAMDNYAKQAEPILTYALNDRQMFPTRESFAFLASEYDDKLNGTDVVLGVENPNEDEFIVCAVDVATGTNRANIEEKLRRAAEWHGDTPPHCAYIKYCRHGGQYWTETEAPKFILGMMPSRLDDAVEKVEISAEGQIQGREPDPSTDFKLMSEMREQIRLHLMELGEDPEQEADWILMEKLKSLQAAVNSKLYKVLGVKGEDKRARAADFQEKYAKFVQKLAEDLVYRNIIIETQRRQKQVRGRSVSRAAV